MNDNDLSKTLEGFTQLMSVILAFPGAKGVINNMLKIEREQAIKNERQRIRDELLPADHISPSRVEEVLADDKR